MVQGIREFMFWSRKTWQTPHGLPVMDKLHAALGLAGEAGEVVDTIKKAVFTPKRLAAKGIVEHDHVSEELGDMLYYWVRICDHYGLDPVLVMNATVDKLEGRYPDKAAS